MKQTILKIINPLLAILMLFQVLSGFFRKEIGRDLFELVHKKGVILLLIVLIIHLILNWGWIVSAYFKRKLK